MKKLNTTTKTYILFSIIITVLTFIGAIYINCMLQYTQIDDYGWHVRAGEWIIQNIKIPHTGIFSWSAENVKWIAHEWLYDVVLYLVCKLDVIKGVALATIVNAITFIICAIYSKIHKIAYDSMPYLFIYILYILFSQIVINIRAQNFSTLLFALQLIIIDRTIKNSKTRLIWLIPIIQILWSNIHGGSSNLCYIVMILMGLTGLIYKDRIKIINSFSKELSIKYLIVAVVSMLTAIINPNGIAGFLYPYNRLHPNKIANINEWHSLDISDPIELFFMFLPLLIVIISLIFYTRKISVQRFVLFFLTFGLQLLARRFWQYSFVCILIITHYYRIHFRFGKIQKSSINDYRAMLGITIGIIILLPISIIKTDFSFYGKSLLSNNDIKIINENIGDRPFNDYTLGSELVRHNMKVFIDGRNDLYENTSVFQDYSDILDNVGIDSIDKRLKAMRKYNFTSYIIQSNIELCNWLEQNGYKRIHIIQDINTQDPYGEYAMYIKE